MTDSTCQICGERSAYALLYFHPKLGDFDSGDPLPEDNSQTQVSCTECAEDLLDKGIAREFALPNPDADATEHADIIKAYLSRGEDEWIASEDYDDLQDSR
ncbi:hypothetical protein [Natrarchaeobaculum sulfurireducens]|uniref:Uncharacterized protein n=1 Tax=Natrarchaeobaculum sulfurireducens TaxID=2044521 RepID=A0A346PPR7_9EURY|nr:hypothetical protein [Natrarchaeobaculum sulfurireducens]AXR81512.1 hypothetical protein AArcMg_1499 [Natrarchaeobaculum sulfurireducens]